MQNNNHVGPTETKFDYSNIEKIKYLMEEEGQIDFEFCVESLVCLEKVLADAKDKKYRSITAISPVIPRGSGIVLETNLIGYDLNSSDFRNEAKSYAIQEMLHQNL